MGFKAFYHGLVHRLKGHGNTFCEGITNNAGGGKWFFFYDFDHDERRPDAPIGLVALAQRALRSEAWELRSTRGGHHLIDWTPRALEDVRKLWDLFHERFHSDYLWTVPLTLRDSPKWDYDTGRVLSPAPVLVISGANCYPPGRIRRAYYRNWE